MCADIATCCNENVGNQLRDTSAKISDSAFELLQKQNDAVTKKIRLEIKSVLKNDFLTKDGVVPALDSVALAAASPDKAKTSHDIFEKDDEVGGAQVSHCVPDNTTTFAIGEWITVGIEERVLQ